MADWAQMVETRDSEIERLTSLVGYWEHRAEEEQVNAVRLRTERDEYREELAKIADFEEWELSAWGQATPVRTLVTDVRPHAAHERDRYRLAWLSARRRAVDEANFGMEALELKEAEIRRLRARLEEAQNV